MIRAIDRGIIGRMSASLVSDASNVLDGSSLSSVPFSASSYGTRVRPTNVEQKMPWTGCLISGKWPEPGTRDTLRNLSRKGRKEK